VRAVLASANPHKAVELGRILTCLEIEPWKGPLPPETGDTFLENARLKARHVHGALRGGAWVLADDSGIAATALGGGPGVRSARFAGEAASDEENLRALLDALAGAPDRRVSYVACLVAIDPDGRELHARGELRGTLAHEARGRGGFGYDPAFVPEGETRTVAELSPAEKDAISHRGRAARALAALMRARRDPSPRACGGA
jgi:XTP/dITP diphosphohydrolase